MVALLKVRSLINIETSKRSHLLMYMQAAKEKRKAGGGAQPQMLASSSSSLRSRAMRSFFASDADGATWNGEMVDMAAQKLFPICFALANVAYWVYYTRQAIDHDYGGGGGSGDEASE